ncbi:class IIb bacteriocin, lactobin A/cerein 7B family [Streptococcus plurextorum]|uniref:class IIb bacteriocin, lactobin A/cerein 7B family n=1 Tax=Streptococcus plurextorum TaxID=456876 RepID=UPI00041F97F4|nr:class IIb bacteriocin, lactobin A/cerein 7B family [Streptococcus plurextorum]QBX10260.1 hypothetical protein JavanS421_0025 [Streptococcus satellite phage Javan421]
MAQFETMDNLNRNVEVLSERELMEIEGGAIPLIGGIAVWKVGVAVVGGVVTLFGGGAALGYYANRP